MVLQLTLRARKRQLPGLAPDQMKDSRAKRPRLFRTGAPATGIEVCVSKPALGVKGKGRAKIAQRLRPRPIQLRLDICYWGLLISRIIRAAFPTERMLQHSI